MEKISKITLTANNGVFKDLIQEIVNNKDLEKFKIIFSANIIETQIIITEKKGFKVIPEDWIKLQQFLEYKTVDLVFTKILE